jgi:hypothetical protein
MGVRILLGAQTHSPYLTMETHENTPLRTLFGRSWLPCHPGTGGDRKHCRNRYRRLGHTAAGATVTAAGSGRKPRVRTVATSKDGNCAATSLPTGNCPARVALKGFKTAIRSGIEIHANGKLTANFKLGLGAVTGVVTVAAMPGPVDLQSATASNPISGAEVAELPPVSRNFVQLIGRIPGGVTVSPADEIDAGTRVPLGARIRSRYS